MRYLSARTSSLLPLLIGLALASAVACGHEANIEKSPPPLIQAPDRLDFGTVPASETKTLPLQVRNLSQEPLRLFASVQPAGQFSLSETILFLERGGVATLDVGYTGLDEDRVDGAVVVFRSTDGAESVHGDTRVSATSTVKCQETAGDIAIGTDGTGDESRVVWVGDQFMVFQRAGASPLFWRVSPEGHVDSAGRGADAYGRVQPLIAGPTGTAWTVASDPYLNSPTYGVWLREAAGPRAFVVKPLALDVLDAGFNAGIARFAVLSVDPAPREGPHLLAWMIDTQGTPTEHALPLPKALLLDAAIVSSGDGFDVAYTQMGQYAVFLTHLEPAGGFTTSIRVPHAGGFQLRDFARSPDGFALLENADGLVLRLVSTDGTEKRFVRLDGTSPQAALLWTGKGWFVAWSRTTNGTFNHVMTAQLSPEGELLQESAVASCSTSGAIQSVALALDDVHQQVALVWTALGPGLIKTRMRLLAESP